MRMWVSGFGLGLQDVTKHGGSAYNLENAENELYGPSEASYKNHVKRSNADTAAAGAGGAADV